MSQFGTDWYNDLNNVDLSLSKEQLKRAAQNRHAFDKQVRKDNREQAKKQREDKRAQQKTNRNKAEQAKQQKKKELIEQRDNAVRAEGVAQRKYLSLPDGTPAKAQALEEVNKARTEIKQVNKSLNALNFINAASSEEFEKSFAKVTGQTSEGATDRTDQNEDTNTGTDNSNTDNSNTGNSNTGNSNSNTGNSNTGNSNTGNSNTGNKKITAFSDAFYSSLSNVANVANNALFANSKDPSGVSAQLREQAALHDKQAGDEQKNAQANMQIANRDYRVEAEKNAVAGAATENAQKVANMGNASAGAAALERGVKSADYNTHMQRSDTQRAEGVKNQREMYGAQQTAAEERGNANNQDFRYRQTQQYNREADSLSKGGTESQQQEQQQEQQPTNTEQQQEQQPTNTEQQQEQQATNTEQQQEQQAINTEQQQEQRPSGDPQHVINALLGSSKGQDLRAGQEGPDKALYDWVVETYGVQPMQPGKHANEDDPNTWEDEYTKQNENNAKAIQALRGARAGEGHDASANYVVDAQGNYIKDSPDHGAMNTNWQAQ